MNSSTLENRYWCGKYWKWRGRLQQRRVTWVSPV